MSQCEETYYRWDSEKGDKFSIDAITKFQCPNEAVKEVVDHYDLKKRNMCAQCIEINEFQFWLDTPEGQAAINEQDGPYEGY